MTTATVLFLAAALLSAGPQPAQPRAEEPATAGLLAGIRGRITDAETGEPLIACVVTVTEGARASAETDLEGHYVLSLPDGRYTLRVWYDQYEGVDVKNVQVIGGVTVQDVALEPVRGEFTEDVVVIGEVDRRSESGQLLERRMAATVSDSVAAEQISRAPDSSAADAVKRVSAVTLVGRSVFLRGLGGRYASTLVNGVQLPSTDPDGHQSPLELFPSSMLSNLTVQKTFAAELPGAFAGGVLGIETNAYPRALTAQVKLSAGANSLTTGQARRTYRGAEVGLLGWGDGAAGLPSAVPGDRALTLNDSDAEQASESFRNVWSSTRTRALPSGGLSLSLGDTLALRPGRTLGYLASLSVGRSEGTTLADARNFALAGDALTERDRYASEVGVQGTSVGALLNAGLRLDAANDVSALALFSQAAESSAQVLGGFWATEAQDFEATRLKFTRRTVSFNQLRGHHHFGADSAALFKWQANLSFTDAQEPDTRDIAYTDDALGVRRYRQAANSGERFFSTLSDLGGGASAALVLPIGAVDFQAGVGGQANARRFDARRFQFMFVGEDPSVLSLAPEQMLDAANVGPSFLASERTFVTDAYDAAQATLSAFAQVELRPLPSLRALVGLRGELFHQRLTSASRYAAGQAPAPVDRTQLDPMPSVNLTYEFVDAMQVRAGYSYTVARPQLRELAPFLYYDVARRRGVSGNPALVSSHLHNADLRWEWYPSESELLSAGAFFKHFEDPIEQVVVSSIQGDLGYRNADAAQSYGAELEARVGLGRLHRWLGGLRAGGNLSLIASRVVLGADQAVSTSKTRPLQGQSPYVANVNLAWRHEGTGTELTVLYNVFGPRISEAGFNGLPDTYEQPFHRVDATLVHPLSPQLKLKLSGANLLAQESVFRQQGQVVYRLRTGVSATAQLEWSPF